MESVKLAAVNVHYYTSEYNHLTMAQAFQNKLSYAVCDDVTSDKHLFMCTIT